MPRALATDFLHNFRFNARAKTSGMTEAENLFDRDNVLPTGAVREEAGFNSITSPEMSTDAVEYREGMYNFTRKQTGIPTVSDVTFSRGVILGDSSLYGWFRTHIDGGEYRADVQYWLYHRTAMAAPSSTASKFRGFSSSNTVTDATKALSVMLHEAAPIRFKPFGDMDATASDISLQEMDVTMEYWDYVDLAA